MGLATAFLRERPGIAVANMYGITETTVPATFKRLLLPDLVRAEPRNPIGAPLPHLRIDLRDEWGEPVPQGETGEIYVCGSSVAHGYWRRLDITAERFVPDSYIVNGERRARHWYRSGDLARRLPSGEYDYRGRCEDQLKVDGFRIDPSEVEDAFRHCPYERGVAARDVLPRHMRPARFTDLPHLPLTPSGKPDRRALAPIAGSP
jgi:nonribosomal peptide synthetase DhbF